MFNQIVFKFLPYSNEVFEKKVCLKLKAMTIMTPLSNLARSRKVSTPLDSQALGEPGLKGSRVKIKNIVCLNQKK